MKRILLFSIFAFIFSSCAPALMKDITKQLPPLEESAEVSVFEMGDTVPENAEVLGGIAFARNSDWETVLETAKKTARAAGGNGLEIQMHIFPSQKQPIHGISAFILNVDNNIKHAKPVSFDRVDFHDYIVKKEGDTIPCSIIYESDNDIAFNYGYNNQGYRKTISTPKSDLLSYHITDPEALAEQQKRKAKSFDIQFAVDGGYYLNVENGVQNNYNYSHFSKGFIGTGDVRFNIKNGSTLGLHYSYNNGKGWTYYNYGYHGHNFNNQECTHFIAGSIGLITSYLSNHQKLNFLLDGGCEIKPSMIKHRLSMNVLLGYLFYREEGEHILSGGTFGIGGNCGYDYMVTEHIGLGIGWGFTMGIPFKATNEVETREIKPMQFDLTAGIHYYF